jgi:SAM-dependent methyltransferase
LPNVLLYVPRSLGFAAMSVYGALYNTVARLADGLAARDHETRRARLRAAAAAPSTLALGQGVPVEVASEHFARTDGPPLPVHPGYRYALSRGLTYLPSVEFLRQLTLANIAEPSEGAFYRKAIGERTLTVPIDEARSVARVAAERVRACALFGDTAEDPVFRPSDARLATDVEKFVGWNRAIIERVSAHVDLRLPTSPRLLEVGFSSGGHSQFAFERLGFQVVGLDSSYDGTMTPPMLHEDFRLRLKSRARFEYGDLCARTPFEDGAFDVIYSVSVFEHLRDPTAALAEMRRLLAPGGFMLHRYGAFFFSFGGHSWANLDCPWGHLRVSPADHAHYIERLRPFEAPVARAWLTTTLNRKLSIARLQRLLYEGGWRIMMWEEFPDMPERLAELDHEIISDCFARHPGITLADLASRDILFLAFPA